MNLFQTTQTTYTYDPASQVTNILHQLTASSTQINKADYLYNNVGNRTSLTDRRGAQAFGYDNLDRLTSASHPLLGTPQAFAYDPVGNRTTNGSQHNAGNQLTADASFTYQYDDNGNLTRKTITANGNYTQYTYDAENRLTKVEEFTLGNPTPVATSTYRYDGLGRRIEKVANGQTKRYIYDGEDILLEYDGTNTLVARYTHGPGIDEPIAMTRGGSTFFYHQDGLGTVTDLTDSTGATAKSYAYDAYGNILESPGTVDQPYTYTGRELDSESGLYYYRARSYDSDAGRFLERDPIGFRGGINLYQYVRSNPTNRIDPSGTTDNACTYYKRNCDASGGLCIYDCNTAPFMCQNPYFLPTLWFVPTANVNCIRNCLQVEDRLARQDKANITNDGCPACVKDSVIDSYHRSCFERCGVDPSRYRGVWPFGNGSPKGRSGPVLGSNRPFPG
jgi:RHS repeat-associated protein